MARLISIYIQSFFLLLVLAACSSPQNVSPPANSQAADTVDTAETPAPETSPPEDDPFASTEIEFPAADPVFGMLGSRQLQSLNGEWKYIVDPMGVGNTSVLQPGFFNDAKNETGMELIEYDFEAADTLRVPGDWNSQKERLFFYRGQVWYRRIFIAEPKRGERYHLQFGGANFGAQVFLNGTAIGAHEGGYVPFAFDVTKTLEKGENTLVVRVDNTLGKSTIPTGRTDWWPYGGLTRDVALITTPKAFIRNAKMTLLDHEAGRISVRVETEGLRRGAKATLTIEELGLRQAIKIGKDGTGTAEFTAAPQLWSPDNPKLYDVVITAGKDRLEDRIGFRTIQTQGAQILLNGKPLKLKGISTHEEPIGEPGAAFSKGHAKGILTEAKALGANFVRAAHYPYSRHMAEAADEMGLLLWEEIPVYWSIDWTNPDTQSIAQDQMRRLITRDWNRASVIVWSVANETPASGARNAFLESLIDETRRLDGSRLVSAALLGGSRESFEAIVTHLAVRGLKTKGLSVKDNLTFRAIKLRAGFNPPKPGDIYTLVIDDPLAEKVDLISYNEYFGWYYSKIFAEQTGIEEDVLRPLMLDLIPDMRITAALDKPVHISEFGAGAKHGRKGGAADIWSEEYQAAVYAAQIKMLRRSPQVQGMTPWILKDFRAMLRTRGGVQDFYNRKGLVDENGNRKLAFDVLRGFYEGEWEEQVAE